MPISLEEYKRGLARTGHTLNLNTEPPPLSRPLTYPKGGPLGRAMRTYGHIKDHVLIVSMPTDIQAAEFRRSLLHYGYVYRSTWDPFTNRHTEYISLGNQ